MSGKTANYIPGLEGVVAAQTRLSRVDGQKGELIIGGYPLETLAPNASFEEMIYLLWNSALPTALQLESLQNKLATKRELPFATLDLLRNVAKTRAPVMDALRMAASTLSLSSEVAANGDDIDADAIALVAAFPSIVAAYWRLLNGQPPVMPSTDLSHAANYLYMLTGETPGEAKARGLEIYLNTVVDHGLNASTFTARVIASTASDLVSAVTGAIGALKGPLHGGAPGPALDMVFEIGQPDKAEPYMRKLLNNGERLMGFGHRVYKVRDPRAEVLSQAAQAMYAADGDMQLFELVKHVEKVAVELLDEYKPGRNLQTNVEFYTALLLHGLGLHAELFSPTFAISRVVGWLAHCFEQQQTERILRPRAEYIGETEKKWVAIGDRSGKFSYV
ncbi:MAG: citrate synthase/methylcitrate synthase [Chloroflexi bacterium]|nr:MAG: citrate synthase/methylcitrate synthase [Chloroflexota bacterium]MBL1193708.1 citrate synthase/methylcitrate synthase [Chloroflexota bacterium]NOH11001.1 citrate synthase/methylcitrate synthase [Chloroflexota bacterium]